MIMLVLFPKLCLIYLVFLKTLESPLKVKIKFCGFKQCLAARQHFEMTCQTLDIWCFLEVNAITSLQKEGIKDLKTKKGQNITH